MEILINNSYGGFGLSDVAVKMYNKKKNTKYTAFDLSDYSLRTDKDLIDIVRKLGPEANRMGSDIGITEIPDGSYFVIDDDDGAERLFYSESKVKKA